jgi:hypothetical protein
MLFTNPERRSLTTACALGWLLLRFATPAMAQTSSPPAPPPTAPEGQQSPDTPAPPPSTPPPDDNGNQPEGKNRVFGVMPNYTTVERKNAPPVETKEKFKMAALDSFDPFVFPFNAFTAGVAQAQNEIPSWGHGWEGYAKRYALSFADNTMASFMTSAVLPTLLHQDPRYFVLGEGGFKRRMMYGLSRTIYTRGQAGQRQFNFSGIGGNGAATFLSALYHPPEDRAINDLMMRWGMQMVWDALSTQLKEFWPDIRHRMHRS